MGSVVLDASVPYGQKIKASVAVRVTNVGDFTLNGPVPISVRLSPGDTPTISDPEVLRIFKTLKLKPGQGKTIKVRLATLPAVTEGDYHLGVIVDPDNALSEKSETNNAVEDPGIHHVAAPVVDLAGTYRVTPGQFIGGKKLSAVMDLTNTGNIPLVATVNVRVVAAKNANGTGAIELGIIPLRLKIKQGLSHGYRVKFFVPPDMPGGNYFLITTLDSTNALAETNENNNTLTAGPVPLTAVI